MDKKAYFKMMGIREQEQQIEKKAAMNKEATAAVAYLIKALKAKNA